jgi:hypothetical protein
MESETTLSSGRNRFKPDDLVVVSGNPFHNDKLNRQEEIENLSLLLSNSNGPLVLAIEAAWGSGKTAFMKMWLEHLRTGFPQCMSIYFSAWETDFSDDPLFVFLAEVNKQLASKTSGMTLYKWNQAISLAGRITKRAIPALIKVATYGALDMGESRVERTFAELTSGIASDTLESYKSSVSAIQQFKDNLKDVLHQTANGSPVIVFIDELDRCRPGYSILFLERIKHLLNLPDLIFILGIDRTQLANAIRGVYGQCFDAEIYLQRFIDLDYRLSPGNYNDFVQGLLNTYDLVSFFDARNGVDTPSTRNELDDLANVCADIAKLFSLSLREIEQLLARVNIVARSTEKTQPVFPHLLVGLLAIRSKSPELYEGLMEGKCTSKDFKDLITRKYENASLASAENIGKMIAFMVLALSSRNSSDPGKADLIASQNSTNHSESMRALIDSICKNYDDLTLSSHINIDLQSLGKRIEMAQRFLA